MFEVTLLFLSFPLIFEVALLFLSFPNWENITPSSPLQSQNLEEEYDIPYVWLLPVNIFIFRPRVRTKRANTMDKRKMRIRKQVGNDAGIAPLPPQTRPKTVTEKAVIQRMMAGFRLHEEPHISDIRENGPNRESYKPLSLLHSRHFDQPLKFRLLITATSLGGLWLLLHQSRDRATIALAKD